MRVSLAVWPWSTQFGVSLPGECGRKGLVLGAERDKVGCPLILLASLNDARAGGTNCCGQDCVMQKDLPQVLPGNFN